MSQDNSNGENKGGNEKEETPKFGKIYSDPENMPKPMIYSNCSSNPNSNLYGDLIESNESAAESSEKRASTGVNTIEKNPEEKSEEKTKVKYVTIKSKYKSRFYKLKFFLNDAILKRLKQCKNFKCKQKGFLYEIRLSRKEMKKLEKAGFFKNPQKAKTIKNIVIKMIFSPKKREKKKIIRNNQNDTDYLEMDFNIESAGDPHDYPDDEKLDPENLPLISSNHGNNKG